MSDPVGPWNPPPPKPPSEPLPTPQEPAEQPVVITEDDGADA